MHFIGIDSHLQPPEPPSLEETLTEIGFINVKKQTLDETIDALHEQSYAVSIKSSKLLDEIQDAIAPVSLVKDNYEEHLDAWIEDVATELHATEPEPPKRKCRKCDKAFTSQDERHTLCAYCAWIS